MPSERWRDTYDEWKLRSPYDEEPYHGSESECCRGLAPPSECKCEIERHDQQRAEIATLRARIITLEREMKEAEVWVRRLDAAGKIDLTEAPNWLVPF